jgi:hypothetical protein
VRSSTVLNIDGEERARVGLSRTNVKRKVSDSLIMDPKGSLLHITKLGFSNFYKLSTICPHPDIYSMSKL